jgi:hypothetical protein
MKRVVAVVSGLCVVVGMAIAAPPVMAEDMTTLTLKVTGCDGCTISAWTPTLSSEGGPTVKAKVKDGIATLQIPTAQTTGTSFQLDPVQDPLMNAVTLIVFQYKGAQPGARITKAQAKTYRRGSACWTGTSEATAELRVRVRRVWGPAFDPLVTNPPKRSLQPLAWVVPTQQSAAPYWPLFKGALQTQNNPICRF